MPAFHFNACLIPLNSVQQDACDIHISCDSRIRPRGTFPCNPFHSVFHKLYGTAIENVNVNYINQKKCLELNIAYLFVIDRFALFVVDYLVIGVAFLVIGRVALQAKHDFESF